MSFAYALQFAKEYPAVLALVTFGIGLYVGNKQAIGRDKRKEFNDLSETAFIALNKQLEHLKHGLPGHSVDDFPLIYSHIPFYKRWLFKRHVKSYQSARQGISEYDVESGAVNFDKEKLAKLQLSVKALLCYLKPR